MRLWTFHPKYLDSKGLVAVWREGLLAQAVLLGRTKWYKNHSQLIRFKNEYHSIVAIGLYLFHILNEADAREYNFDIGKIEDIRNILDNSETVKYFEMTEMLGQLLYEWKFFQKRLTERKTFSKNLKSEPYRVLLQNKKIDIPDPHPLFKIVEGDVRGWEKVKKL
jgi:hypothetical protein